MGHSVGSYLRDRADRRDLYEGMAADSPHPSSTVSALAAGVLSWRTAGALHSRRLAARYVQRIAAVHAHGAALGADVDGAAAHRPWRAGGAHDARPAALDHPPAA